MCNVLYLFEANNKSMESNAGRAGRTARTFRIPNETNALIKEIGKRLKENDTDVLIRAIDYLNDNLKTVVEADTKSRLTGLK
jgi:hypothetical protein